jgi:hypothetical protein
MDDVKNSEYVEEDVLKHSTVEEKHRMFYNSRIIADESVKFAFNLDGGTGGQLGHT